ncbi:MAG: hypothetical protein COB02_08605 [Candidatus Cloacimonadota bacterium]|nr:MAG: hypothetical protein COB02_08605 [Candidatus Cloacimonadota bacterium]
MKYLILLIVFTQIIFCEHVLYQVKRHGELIYFNSSNGNKESIALKVNKFKIAYPWIAYTNLNKNLYAKNLRDKKVIDLGKSKLFKLGSELLAFTNTKGKLYSLNLSLQKKRFHELGIRSFKTSRNALIWTNKKRTLKYYNAISTKTKVLQKYCEFFQVSWPMLSHVDMGHQLYGTNLKSEESRVLLSSFYIFQAASAGILTLDRSYKLRYYNTSLKRVGINKDIERVKDFKFVDHFILYRQYDTKNLMFRNLRAPETILRSKKPKTYQLAPHTLTIINNKGGLEIENSDYKMFSLPAIYRAKSKYKRLLTGNSILSYTIRNQVFLYNAKIGKEYKIAKSVYWMELEGMNQRRPLKSLKKLNFSQIHQDKYSQVQ